MLKIRFDLSKNPFKIHLIIISVYPPKPLNQRSYFFYLVFQQTLINYLIYSLMFLPDYGDFTIIVCNFA